MLTVLITHHGEVIYLRPFTDHEEAIRHFGELWGSLYNNAVLEITNREEIRLKEKDETGYIV